jgi:hypothetical protein
MSYLMTAIGGALGLAALHVVFRWLYGSQHQSLLKMAGVFAMLGTMAALAVLDSMGPVAFEIYGLAAIAAWSGFALLSRRGK